MKKNKQDNSKPEVSSVLIPSAVRHYFGILFFLIIITWALLIFLLTPNISAAIARFKIRNESAIEQQIHSCKKGPWGRLSYSQIIIETPEEFLDQQKTKPRKTTWFFKEHTRESLQKFIAETPLKPAQKAIFHTQLKRRTSPNGIFVYPTVKFVMELQPEARRALYQELSRFAENPYHQAPYTFPATMQDHWLKTGDIPVKTKLMIRKLLYDRGTMKAFADINLVLSELDNEKERETLIKALSRSASLFPKLRVSSNTDIDNLADYWMKGGKAKDIRPILRSVAQIEGGADIDLVHLLPPIPRMLAFTHTTPQLGTQAKGRSLSHWTAANFFNTEPDNRFLDTAHYIQLLNKEYQSIPSRPHFGDIILLASPDGKLIHSCNYIADDIVLTKNGTGLSSPWVFMKLEEVEELHSYRDFKTLTIRRKEPQE